MKWYGLYEDGVLIRQIQSREEPGISSFHCSWCSTRKYEIKEMEVHPK